VKIHNTRIFTVTAGFFLTALLIVSSMQLSQFFINNAKASTGDNIGPVNYGDVNQYEWPMWKGSETWACFNPGPAPNSPDLKWIVDAPGASSGRYYPCAANGKVYIYNGARMQAFDGQTGALVWNESYPSSASGPTKIDDHHMVAGSNCFDPDTGALLWRATPTPSPLTGLNYTFATSPDFRSAGGYSSTYKMYVNHGLGWNFSDPSKPPVLQWDISNTLFGNFEFESVGTTNNGTGVALYHGDTVVYGINIETGGVLWTAQTSAGYNSYQGCYYDGAFYKGLIDGTFWAINATDGSIMWTYPNEMWYTNFGCSCAAAYGMVYEIRSDGTMFAFNAKNGDVVWTYKTNWMFYWGGPVVADGKIFVTDPDSGRDPYTGETVDGTEYVSLDAFTGKLLWKMYDLKPGSAGAEATMIAYGNLYVISDRGKLRCYGEKGQDWPMYRHDPQGTNVGASGPNQMEVRWKFPTIGQVIGSAAIVNQKVYIGSYDKNLYCIDLWTGEKIWNFTTNAYIGWSPAVIGGRVYTGADDGNVYCLDANDGKIVWQKQITEYAPGNLSARYSYPTPSPLIYGNKLYIGGVDGKEYCLSLTDGAILWSFDTAPGEKRAFITNLKSSGTIGSDGNLYVVGSPASNAQKYQIYKLDPTSGTVLLQWRMPYTSYPPSTDTIFATPLVVEDRLYIADQNSRFYCFNTTDGQQIWNYTTTGGGVQNAASAVYFEGNVYFSGGMALVCANASTGEVVWNHFLAREVYSNPTIAGYGNTGLQADRNNAKIYIGENMGFEYCMNLTTSEKISWYSTGSFVDSSVALSNGKAVVGSRDFNIYCFEEANPTPPLTLQINIDADKTQANPGTPVTIQGTIFPVVRNLPLDVTFYNADGSQTSNTAAYDSETGAFTTTYTPNVSGQLNIEAKTPANKDANVAESKSNTVSIDIQTPTTPTPPPTQTPTQTPPPTTEPTPTVTTPPPTPQPTTESTNPPPSTVVTSGLNISYEVFYAGVAVIVVAVIASTVAIVLTLRKKK
jgi:outer membrane protein assembly factor BamB